MTIKLTFNTEEISLMEFCKLDMSSRYLGCESMSLDIDSYAHAQTMNVLIQQSLAESSSLHLKTISPIQARLINATPTLETVNFTNHFDSNAFFASLFQKNFWLNPLVFYNIDARIVQRADGEGGQTQLAVQQTSPTRTRQSFSPATTHSEDEAGIGGSGGDDPPRQVYNWIKGHYIELNDEMILAILKWIFIKNLPQISSQNALDLIPNFQRLCLAIERNKGRVFYQIDDRTYQRAVSQGGNKHFIRITSLEFNRSVIYIRRGTEPYYALETRPKNIEGINSFFAGGRYSERSTSLGSSRASSTRTVTIVQPIVQPVAQPAAQPAAQPVAQDEIQAQAELQHNNLQSFVNFAILAALGIGIAQGGFYLWSRRLAGINLRIRNDGRERGRRDFYNLTQAQGFEIFGINFNGVPAGTFAPVPPVNSENRDSLHYYSGLRDELEQSQYQYENSYPRHASRMRRVLNRYEASLQQPINSNLSNQGHGQQQLFTAIFSLVIAAYNANTGTLDFITIWRNIRRNNNNH